MGRALNIWFILTLAAFLRICWAFFVEVDPISDPGIYDEFARSIVEGRGYAYSDGTLTAFWPAGTSAVYALLYWIFGYTYIPIIVFNLLIGLLIVYLTWDIGKYYFSESTATSAALLMAVWPLLIQFTTVLASEMIFLLLMLLTLKVFISTSLPMITKAILFGLLIGLCCYVRPLLLPLLAILPALQAIRSKKMFPSLVIAIIAALVTSAVIHPWSQRNTKLFGEPTSLSTNFGPNLWMGNNPASDGAYMPMPDKSYSSEKERDNQLKQEAIDFIVNNPEHFIRLAFKRLFHTFSRETIGIVWNERVLLSLGGEQFVYSLKLISTLYWQLMLWMGIAGIIIFTLHNGWLTLFFPPIVLFAFLFSIPLIIVGQDRYHIPMIPFIALFAAYFTHHVAERHFRAA